MKGSVDFCYFTQPLCHKEILGVHANLPKCWRDTW